MRAQLIKVTTMSGMGNSEFYFNSCKHSINEWSNEALEIAAMLYRDRMTTSYTVSGVVYCGPVEVEPQDCYKVIK